MCFSRGVSRGPESVPALASIPRTALAERGGARPNGLIFQKLRSRLFMHSSSSQLQHIILLPYSFLSMLLFCLYV